jgi:ribose/xylose/arabinose/galactoside ABC-type transport system permease subunit
MLTGKLGIVDPAVGKGYELLVVTCVVVGGVSISGGRGKLRGVVLAVILMVMIKTVLIFLKLGDEATKWERAIQGAFILLAVVLDHLAAKRSAGGRA